MPVLGLALAFAALASSTPATASTQSVSVPATQSVEQYVREYFSDVPVMAEVAKCESRFRQYDATGKVLRNEQGSSAVGAFQIMASIHAASAGKNLGMDIYTLDGNSAYARYLYNRQGLSPWLASKACWSKTTAYQAYVAQRQVALK